MRRPRRCSPGWRRSRRSSPRSRRRRARATRRRRWRTSRRGSPPCATGSGRWRAAPRSPSWRSSWPGCMPRRTRPSRRCSPGLAPWRRSSRRWSSRDPRALLDRFAERLEAVQGRLASLEDKTPFAELTEQLAGLYAQKDATVETVFARLAPLEAKLAALELARPAGAARPLRRAAGGGAGPAGGARGQDAVRGAHRAADRALCPEGCDRRDGVRAAGAARGAAGGAGARRPAGAARPLRRAAGGGAGPPGERWRTRRRSRSSPSS